MDATTTKSLHAMLRAIIDEGEGTVIASVGEGGEGGQYEDADTLQDMLDTGNFDGWSPVPVDRELMRGHFDQAGMLADLDDPEGQDEWHAFERWGKDDKGAPTGSGEIIYVWKV